MENLLSAPSFEQLFDPSSSASHPFDMDPLAYETNPFLSFSSLGEFDLGMSEGPGRGAKQMQPFWMDDEALGYRVTDAKHQSKASLSDLAAAFNLPSPPHSSSSSSEMTSNAAFFSSADYAHPSPPISSIPSSATSSAFPYDILSSDNFLLEPAGGSMSVPTGAMSHMGFQDFNTPVRGLANKDSMESFASDETAASDLILTPQLRPHTSAGELGYITPLLHTHDHGGFVLDHMYPYQQQDQAQFRLHGSPTWAKRYSYSAQVSLSTQPPAQVHGQSPVQPLFSTGRLDRRRKSVVTFAETIEVAEAEGVHQGVSGPLQGYEGVSGLEIIGASSGSSSYLMPSAEIVGNISNWQATVPTYASQEDFDRIMNARVPGPGALQAQGQGSCQLEGPFAGNTDAGSYPALVPQWTYPQAQAEELYQIPPPLASYVPSQSPVKSVTMRKTKSMDTTRKVSGGAKPKALFAFHPKPMPSSKNYPAAFSTMPLSNGMARATSSQGLGQGLGRSQLAQPQYQGDVFTGPSVMAPTPMARGSSYTAQPTPKAVLSVLARPTVDPSSDVWPPLPPRVQSNTIAPLTLQMPLDFLHNPAPVVSHDVPAHEYQPIAPAQRFTLASASVLQPAPPAAYSLESMESWTPINLEAPAQVESMPDFHQAPPPLTHLPLARPHPSASPLKVISPMPKAPRVRIPSKATPKARKVTTKVAAPSAQAGFGFINFTAIDADKLLTGVAPSGSQKRKRDDSAEVSSNGSCDDSAGLNVVEFSGKRARL